MARVSRSSKKQPAFDPGELQDLIFSPAVGSGVGSHLLVSTDSPTPPQVQRGSQDLTTVDMSHPPSVDTTEGPTVVVSDDDLIASADPIIAVTEPCQVDRDMSTVVSSTPSTVPIASIVEGNSKKLESLGDPRIAVNNLTTVDAAVPPTVGESDLTTVNKSQATEFLVSHELISETSLHGEPSKADQSREAVGDIFFPVMSETVGKSDLSIVSATNQSRKQPREIVLWITEQGDLVPQGRVKRIRLAQDVINSAEESVYDTLWTAKNQTEEREASRIVQAGYDYLVKRTRLSKKTIQRIIAKLIDKDFIAIERPADIYRRTSTVYRVFSYKAVLDRHAQRGRSHVAKMGPGFSYVRPFEDPRRFSASPTTLHTPISVEQLDLTTVDILRMPTVVAIPQSTPANETTETVAGSDASTVVHQTTTSIGKDYLGNNSSSSAIYQALSSYGAVDDDIVNRFIRNCKQQAPDCTEDEIVHFIDEKGSLVRVKDSRIYSPIGFLLTAVPKCLFGEAFRHYREQEMRRREAAVASEARRQNELDEWRKEQEAQLADPTVPEEDKQFIREWLGVQ